MKQIQALYSANPQTDFAKTSSNITNNNNNLNTNKIIFIKTNENTLKGIRIPTTIAETNPNKLMIKPPKIPSYRKSMWSEVEDQLLLNAVQQYGTHNWGLVAASVSGRTRKQCRERWAGKLNPDLAKEPWTNEEDKKLIELHNKLGNKWALISVHLIGRSPIMLKNRWGYILRHSNQSKKGTTANNDQTQARPLIQPIINNDTNHDTIQHNENAELSNAEQKSKGDQNIESESGSESPAIIPPFYPPNNINDNEKIRSHQISRPLPFSLDNQASTFLLPQQL